MKQCSNCKEVKALDEFHVHTKTKDGFQYHCKACKSERNRKRYHENRESILAKANDYYRRNPDYFLMNKYKITRSDYDRILEEQGGGCAICGGGQKNGRMMCVDHDHSCCPGPKSCGKCVRQLLCNGCNSGLGNFAEDIQRMKKAIEYLERHK